LPELVWDRKYKNGKKQGPVCIPLPFQTIETVNESAQDRQRKLEVFSSADETGWRNRLIWGDKKYVLPSLRSEFAGKVNLIYIDPPFNTGGNFSFTATIPGYPNSNGDETTQFTKAPSILEQKAYRDTWGVNAEDRARGVTHVDRYLKWFFETVTLLRDLLSEDGSLYVHLDWHIGAYCKALLDEIFGAERCLNEIIWKRTSARSDSHSYNHIHDTIYLYSKSEKFKFNTQYTPYDQDYLASFYRYEEKGTGRRFRVSDLMAAGTRKGSSGKPWRGIEPNRRGNHWKYTIEKLEQLDQEGKIYWPKKAGGVPGFKRYLDEMPGVTLQSIWTDINPIAAQAAENVNYATQKPEALLERIVKASSDEGDLVLDCVAGSGTTAVVCEKLRRRWIVCDLGRFAIHTTRKRLLGIPGVRPFVVQNLGKYERQAWQLAEFPANGKNGYEKQQQREAAYRAFVLDLYHAPAFAAGTAWLHGTKSGRMVHVGAVDAPVTLSDVKAIAREAWKVVGNGKGAPRRAGVDILGWEFAFELNEVAKQVAAQSLIDVAFKKIPREVLDKKAEEQGDVWFFELGALSVKVKRRDQELLIALTNFIIPTDDIPSETSKAIKHWSQLIDYWAVDWDFKKDTFHNQWQSYRTRKEPQIDMEAKHVYAKGGGYVVVVKVIDILGNDTTKTIEVAIDQV